MRSISMMPSDEMAGAHCGACRYIVIEEEGKCT